MSAEPGPAQSARRLFPCLMPLSSHGLFVSAFPAAFEFLSITVKWALRRVAWSAYDDRFCHAAPTRNGNGRTSLT
jgi:hypothetical protein